MKRPIFAVVVLAAIAASLMAIAAVQANVIGGLVDIKPGGEPNSIRTASRGRIPVAILGSEIFDVTEIDVTTLAFGPAGAAPAHDLTDSIVYAEHLGDVNGDGLTDLVSHYRTQETGIAPGDTQACLMGDLISGVPIVGCDTIRTVP